MVKSPCDLQLDRPVSDRDSYAGAPLDGLGFLCWICTNCSLRVSLLGTFMAHVSRNRSKAPVRRIARRRVQPAAAKFFIPIRL